MQGEKGEQLLLQGSCAVPWIRVAGSHSIQSQLCRVLGVLMGPTDQAPQHCSSTQTGQQQPARHAAPAWARMAALIGGRALCKSSLRTNHQRPLHKHASVAFYACMLQQLPMVQLALGTELAECQQLPTAHPNMNHTPPHVAMRAQKQTLKLLSLLSCLAL